MHIVIDAHLAVKKIDGIARYLNGMLLELPKIDSNVQYTVLSLPPEESSIPSEIFSYPNVKRYELNLMGPSVKQHLIMRRLLKKLRADLYHHPQFDLPLGVDIPSVITIHDLKYIFHPGFLRKRNRLKSLYAKKSLEYSLKAATRIISVSQNTLNDLKKVKFFDPEKVSVIYHGVYPPVPLSEEKINRIKNRFNISTDFILFIGTRRPHKNIEGLVRALALLIKEYGLDIDLVISGKAYSDYQDPETIARELEVASHVHFLDFVEDEALPALYRSARVVALVSFYEGFGLPLVEAMSYGIPVVGSNVGSIPEVIGDAGLLADPANPGAIAEKIYKILTDKAVADKLASAGKLRAQNFSWNNLARATLEVYKEALTARY